MQGVSKFSEVRVKQGRSIAYYLISVEDSQDVSKKHIREVVTNYLIKQLGHMPIDWDYDGRLNVSSEVPPEMLIHALNLGGVTKAKVEYICKKYFSFHEIR